MTESQAFWWREAMEGELRSRPVERSPGDALCRTLWSGVSRGTERLVAEGRVPVSEHARMRAPFQDGAFPFPVKYGYHAVARVEEGPEELVGRTVFALHPHQTLFALPKDALVLLPDGLPPRRAALAANMETALNAVWDSGASPGDRIAVVGAGALGLLTASILSRVPGCDVTLCDILSCRAGIAAQLGVKFAAPERAPRDCDVAIHTSATAAGLNAAMETLGTEGTLVELSWHGAGETPVALGGAFHARRLRIVSSQVGMLPAARRARWDYRRRLAMALELLKDDRLDALITDEIAFEDLPARLPEVLRGGGIAAVVRYPEGASRGGSAAL